MSEWISVDFGLPESFGWFLVVDEYLTKAARVTIGFYEGLDSEVLWLPHDDRDDQDSMLVTHWMPLPEPPK
jgi:hypothetical protein